MYKNTINRLVSETGKGPERDKVDTKTRGPAFAHRTGTRTLQRQNRPQALAEIAGGGLLGGVGVVGGCGMPSV